MGTMPLPVLGNIKNSIFLKNISSPPDEFTAMHKRGEGDQYKVTKTVTPFKNEEEIKNLTKVPTDPSQINFISNYRSAFSNAEAYPTQVPFEGEKHWNISRFFVEPHFTKYDTEVERQIKENVGEQNEAQIKNNALYDIYKYYLYQNKGDRDKSFSEAKNFIQKEIEPKVSGDYFKNYFNSTDSPFLGSISSTDFADDNRLIRMHDYHELLKNSPVSRGFNPGYKKEWDVDKLKKTSMDYFINWRKMDKKEAENLWNKWVSEYELHKKELNKYKLSDIRNKKLLSKNK